MLAFSLYGTVVPSQVRCGLPGAVGCPHGIFGAAVGGATAGEQFFTVTMYDWGFWIVDSTSGANETHAWNVFEGWTVHINATSLPANAAIGGTAYHGLGIELNATGQQLLSLAAPVGQWVTGIFIAPTSTYHNQHIWCTISCGPGHGSQQAYVLNVIPPAPLPQVKVGANVTSGTAPLSVALTGNVTSGTPPFNLSWSFGDGTPGAYGLTASHTYTLGGTYYASLLATDSKGYQARSAVTVTVLSTDPLTASLAATPSAGVAPLAVALSTIAHGSQPPYTFDWSFGDGANSSGPNGTAHLFRAPGIYAVAVTVHDSLGATQRALASITVSVPSGSFPVSIVSRPLSGPAPFQPQLNATPGGGTGPYAYAWLLGDGSTATGAAVSPIYNTTGIYEATAFVTDAAGRLGTATVSVVATTASTGDDGGGNDSSPRLQPAAAGTLRVVLGTFPSAGGAPLTVNATASVIGGTATNVSVSWSFGDGGSATGQVVTHRFAAVGSYTLSVTASDSGGNTGANTTVVSVVGLTMSIVTNRTGCDAPCTLAAAATVLGGTGSFSGIRWAFGDGTGTTGDLVVHDYSNGSFGPLVLTATATDRAGATVSATTTVTVYPLPVALVLVDRPASPSGPPVTVTLTVQVTGGSGTYASEVFWNFGDLSTTRAPTVTNHTFNTTGHFLVSALTNDSLGTYALGSAWVNVSSSRALGPPGGGGGGGPAIWVFNGVSNPDQAALVLMGMVAATGLAMLVRRRVRARATPLRPKAPAAPRAAPRSAPASPRGPKST
jgi:PKD repeat protein